MKRFFALFLALWMTLSCAWVQSDPADDAAPAEAVSAGLPEVETPAAADEPAGADAPALPEPPAETAAPADVPAAGSEAEAPAPSPAEAAEPAKEAAPADEASIAADEGPADAPAAEEPVTEEPLTEEPAPEAPVQPEPAAESEADLSVVSDVLAEEPVSEETEPEVPAESAPETLDAEATPAEAEEPSPEAESAPADDTPAEPAPEVTEAQDEPAAEPASETPSSETPDPEATPAETEEPSPEAETALPEDLPAEPVPEVTGSEGEPASETPVSKTPASEAPESEAEPAAEPAAEAPETEASPTDAEALTPEAAPEAPVIPGETPAAEAAEEPAAEAPVPENPPAEAMTGEAVPEEPAAEPVPEAPLTEAEQPATEAEPADPPAEPMTGEAVSEEPAAEPVPEAPLTEAEQPAPEAEPADPSAEPMAGEAVPEEPAAEPVLEAPLTEAEQPATEAEPADPSAEPLTGEDQVICVFEDVAEDVYPADMPEGELTEDLLRAYIEKALQSPLAARYFLNSIRVDDGRLSDTCLALYRQLKPRIEEIAAGREASTEMSVEYGDLGLQTRFTASELGVTIEGSTDMAGIRAGYDLVTQQLRIDYALVQLALLANCPYELYWYDKAAGARTTATPRVTVKLQNGEYVYEISSPYSVRMTVSQDYSADTYTVDTSVGRTVQGSVRTAQSIVDKYRDLNDLEKLEAYRDEICALVSYNHDAVRDGAPYGDPWQLVYVFDEDEGTNVVCEGYAKAFQYLCDMTDFDGDVNCYSVTGTMDSGTGAGAHMWNIVTMSDGRNYLVDLTNSDQGTFGADGSLFLSGYYDEDQGYIFVNSSDQSITYVYDGNTVRLYTEGELTLAGDRYEATGHLDLYPRHTLTHVARVEPTCEAPGCAAHWVCAQDGRLFADERGAAEVSREALALEPLGHAWGEPAYTWAWDFSSVTAVRTCLHDSLHTETETAAAEAAVTHPGCETAGQTVYTAAFTGDAFAAQEKAVPIPPLGHDWAEPVYVWAEDGSAVTATRVCRRDGSHAETETAAAVPAVLREPGCAEPGLTRLTAAFTSGAFAPQTRDIVTPPAGHRLVFVPAREPSYAADGVVAHWRCEACGLLFADEAARTAVDPASVLIPRLVRSERPVQLVPDQDLAGWRIARIADLLTPDERAAWDRLSLRDQLSALLTLLEPDASLPLSAGADQWLTALRARTEAAPDWADRLKRLFPRTAAPVSPAVRAYEIPLTNGTATRTLLAAAQDGELLTGWKAK